MSYIVVEYLCPIGHRFESLEERPAPYIADCKCGQIADKVLSAPKLRFSRIEIPRGAAEEPPPGVMDCRMLADGKVSKPEWDAMRLEKRRRESHDPDLVRAVDRVLNLRSDVPI